MNGWLWTLVVLAGVVGLVFLLRWWVFRQLDKAGKDWV